MNTRGAELTDETLALIAARIASIPGTHKSPVHAFWHNYDSLHDTREQRRKHQRKAECVYVSF